MLSHERAPAQVEGPTRVPVTTKESRFRFAEAERARELGFSEALSAPAVDENALGFVDVLDAKLSTGVILHFVTDAKRHALDGRGAGCVLPYRVTRGKAHEHTAVRDFLDATETELGFGFADKALPDGIGRHRLLS